MVNLGRVEFILSLMTQKTQTGWLVVVELRDNFSESL